MEILNCGEQTVFFVQFLCPILAFYLQFKERPQKIYVYAIFLILKTFTLLAYHRNFSKLAEAT